MKSIDVTLTAAFIVTFLGASSAWAKCPGPGCPSGIVGGIIGGVLTGDGENIPKRKKVRSRPSTETVEKRAANRRIQTALNFFGFNAGTPDGVLGRRSRAGISNYQAYIGIPVTGALSSDQINTLINAYDYANTEAVQIAQRRKLLAQISNDILGVIAIGPAVAAQASPISTGPEIRRINLGALCTELDSQENAPSGSQLTKRLCETRLRDIREIDSVQSQLRDWVDQCSQISPFVFGSLPKNWNEMRPDGVLAGLNKAISATGTTSEKFLIAANRCRGIGYRLDDLSMVLASGLLGGTAGSANLMETVGLNLAHGQVVRARPNEVIEWLTYAYSISDQPGLPDAEMQKEILKELQMRISE